MPLPTLLPTAHAGNDQTITLPTSTVTLSGSGTDPDGSISAYSWTKISGPASGTITNAASASTTVTSLAQGVYKFQLKVTDNKAATGLDTVQITVNAAANIAPTAHAGNDQTITLPTSSVTLSGSGTDPDGTISAYSWTKVSGPASGTITNAASASTTVTSLAQGVYKFQLKVTDNKAATGLDTVQITVNAGNIAPTAHAGNDQTIHLPTRTATLSGSGTDPDGTISAYQWTKLSGTLSTITSPSSKTTTVTGLLQGTYKFQLTVTDNKGATGKDTVQLTVSQSLQLQDLSTSDTQPSGSEAALSLKTGSEQDISRLDTVYQNVPNPFSYTTTIRYQVAEKAQVKIVVYNANGTPIAVLANEVKDPGLYQVRWNAGNIPSGNYFYTVIVGNKAKTMKMLKLN